MNYPLNEWNDIHWFIQFIILSFSKKSCFSHAFIYIVWHLLVIINICARNSFVKKRENTNVMNFAIHWIHFIRFDRMNWFIFLIPLFLFRVAIENELYSLSFDTSVLFLLSLLVLVFICPNGVHSIHFQRVYFTPALKWIFRILFNHEFIVHFM